jgi:hypothetical protein
MLDSRRNASRHDPVKGCILNEVYVNGILHDNNLPIHVIKAR